ncbi:hypothetical protein J2Y67_005527 [Neobacillus niacini]|nr:hypothetical protein [Neobacillus niacini]
MDSTNSDSGIEAICPLLDINSIMYDGTRILQNAGFGIRTALIGNVVNGLISVIATNVGMSIFHKVNRLAMYLTGLIRCHNRAYLDWDC